MDPVGEVGDGEGLASILGCRVSSLQVKDLGLPLGAFYNTISIWNGIIEKCNVSWLDEKSFIYLKVLD